jgi:hypothetical protein
MDGRVVKQSLVYGFLGIYILYALFAVGMTGLLFSAAVGLILIGLNFSIEMTVAATILSGLIWRYFMMSSGKKEGFQEQPARPAVGVLPDNVPVGTGDTLRDISARVEQIARKDVFKPSGVLSSCFVEGFANADDATNGDKTAGSANAAPAGTTTPPPANSTAAPVDGTTVSPQMAASAPSAAAAAAATPPAQPKEQQSSTTVKQTHSGFADPTTNGMFKLGSIPADAVGGAHIDVGTTLMNAMNALKPDQVKQMTDDTRKLLETQKNLMGMLQSMKPVIQDGKQLMETFGTMFGNQ